MPGGRQLLHLAFGVAFGFFRNAIARRQKTKLRLGYLYSAFVAAAIPAFFGINYLSVAFRVPLFLVLELAFFLFAVTATWYLAFKVRRRQRSLEMHGVHGTLT